MRAGSARPRIPLALLWVALVLGGCSMVSTLYDQLDTLAMWEARSWLDLDREQARRFRHGLGERLSANRQDELPRYRQWIVDLAAAVSTEPSPDVVHALIERSRSLLRETALATAPLLAATLHALRPEQVEYLAVELAESNAEYREEYLDGEPERLRKEQLRAIHGSVERWSGRLGEAQRARLARLLDELPPGAERWYVHRLRWQEQLLALLRGGADALALESLLRRWWGDEAVYDADYAAQLASNRWMVAAALAEVIVSLEPAQRARAQERLLDLADELAELHHEGVAAGP